MPDIEPGLYRHYKGNLYRVLFLARYADVGNLEPDADVTIFVDPEFDDHVGGLPLAVARSKNVDYGMVLDLLAAKNSTDGPTPEDCDLVVYVGLYGDGRLSVRELGEFALRKFTLPGALDAKRPRFVRVKCTTCMDDEFVLDGPDSDQVDCSDFVPKRV